MSENKHTPGPVESCDTCKNNGGTRGECQNESCAYEPKTKPLEVELAALRKQRDELLAAIRDAKRTASLMHTEYGHEVVCIDPQRWKAIASVKGGA